MKKRIYLIALLSLWAYSAHASEYEGFIGGEGLRFSTGASPVRVSVSVSQATACPGSGWYAYENADNGLAGLWTTALIEAKVNNKPIKIVGTGTCDDFGIETINFLDQRESAGLPVQPSTSGISIPPVISRLPDDHREVPVPIKGPPPIRGFADIHTHQFANLAFGGRAVVGEAYGNPREALQVCTPSHGLGGQADVMANLIKAEGPEGLISLHSNYGYPSFEGWPHSQSVSHQQMWEEWLSRAHRGGLQLMVMHAVNNEHFCANANKVLTCNDQEVITLQLNEAKKMEAYIDEKNGGPGKGWYRIVYSPQDARAAISKGQLAVVLGIEVDDPFPCPPGRPCHESALAQLESYYDAGVRHIFPIHFRDNTAGGTAFDKLIIIPEGRAVVPVLGPFIHPYHSKIRKCSGIRYEGGYCNQLGLTPVGKIIIQGMMSKGMLIDVDHMSSYSFADTLSLTQEQKYPVIAGHAGFTDLAEVGTALDGAKSHEGNLNLGELRKISKSNGMIGLVLNQGGVRQIGTQKSGPPTIEHICGNSSESFAQAYLYAIHNSPGMPIAFGTDMNAFFTMPGPRFGNERCPGGIKTDTAERTKKITYPFKALANGTLLDKSKAVDNDSAVTKTYDFNYDGLAHIGLLPDFIEDLRILGLGDKALEPLMSSAEGYVRVWERAIANKLPAEDSACSGLRGQLHQIENDNESLKHEVLSIKQDERECMSSGGRNCTKIANAQLADNKARGREVSKSRIEAEEKMKTKACWYGGTYVATTRPSEAPVPPRPSVCPSGRKCCGKVVNNKCTEGSCLDINNPCPKPQ